MEGNENSTEYLSPAEIIGRIEIIEQEREIVARAGRRDAHYSVRELAEEQQDPSIHELYRIYPEVEARVRLAEAGELQKAAEPIQSLAGSSTAENFCGALVLAADAYGQVFFGELN